VTSNAQFIAEHRARRQLASNVRTIRTHAGLTQERLAERAGIDPSTIQKVEAGTLNPSLLTAAALARGLGCTTAQLLTHL
jgi:transcriptional regulator with XRE-family HTH domain